MQSIGKTDKGKVRDKNQDNFYCSNEKIGNLPNLYIIADGMGGHSAGEYASFCAVEEFINYVKACEDASIEKIFINAINYINKRIYNKSLEDNNYYGMGTTFVVASICKDKLYVANVGDSRLYVINNTIHQITKDHSLVEEMIQNGKITRDEEKDHPDKNIITRAIGVAESVETDVFVETINNEDVILMCSDGLSNMLDDYCILNIVNENTNIKEAIDLLISHAVDNGGTDDITTILIRNEVEEKCYNLE